MTHTVKLGNPFTRKRACDLVMKAPDGFVCEVKEPSRTLDQNRRLWALLTDVAVSKPLDRRHTPEEWKCIFMSACGWEVAFLPGLDGRFLPYGYRSSKLSKTQMSTLQDFILAWGTENGVRWTDEQEDAA